MFASIYVDWKSDTNIFALHGLMPVQLTLVFSLLSRMVEAIRTLPQRFGGGLGQAHAALDRGAHVFLQVLQALHAHYSETFQLNSPEVDEFLMCIEYLEDQVRPLTQLPGTSTVCPDSEDDALANYGNFGDSSSEEEQFDPA